MISVTGGRSCCRAAVLIGLVLAVCLALGATGSAAAQGGAPPGATPISDCTTISSSGAYVLTDDVIDSTAGTCIQISASDVVLYGDGHIVDGVGDPNTHGIYAQVGGGAANVTVRNLALTDWETGVGYNMADDGAVEHVTVEDTDVGVHLTRGSDDNRVEALDASSNDAWALEIEGSSGTDVVDLAATDNENGVRVATASDDTRISGAHVQGSTGSGVLVTGSDAAVVEDATVTGSHHGVVIDDASDALVRDSAVDASADQDVLVSNGATNATLGNLTLATARLSGTVEDAALNASSAVPPLPTGYAGVDQFVDASPIGSGPALDLTFHYDPAAATLVQESSLALHRHDGSWSPVAGSTVDPAANEVSGSVTGLASAGEVLAPTTDDAVAPITGCTNVTQSGTYALTADISTSAVSVCIDVQADDVRIEGNDHVIDGDNYGVAVRATNQDDVTVGNVTVTDWNAGFVAEDASAVHVGPMDVSGTNAGVRFDDVATATIADVAFTNGAQGNNPFFGGGDDQGIRIRQSTDVTVEDSSVTDSEGSAVVVFQSQGTTLRDVGGHDSAHIGIQINQDQDTTAEDLRASGNTEHGINVQDSQSTTIDGYTAWDNTDAGVTVASDDVELRNGVATGNEWGLNLEDAVPVVRNGTFDDNAYGVRSAAGATDFGGVRARDNDWDVLLAGVTQTGAVVENVSVGTARVDAEGRGAYVRGNASAPADPSGTNNVSAYVDVYLIDSPWVPGNGRTNLTLHYPPESILHVQEPSIRAYEHDGSWSEVPSPNDVDEANDTVTVRLDAAPYDTPRTVGLFGDEYDDGPLPGFGPLAALLATLLAAVHLARRSID